MRKSIVLFFVIMLAFFLLVFAEIDTDLRFKFGSAGSDRIELNAGHGSKSGTNAQIELSLVSTTPPSDCYGTFFIETCRNS
jgi:hypothetical protein